MPIQEKKKVVRNPHPQPRNKRREWANKRREVFQDIVARIVFNNIDVYQDRDPEFNNQVIKHLMKEYQIAEETAIRYLQLSKSLVALNLDEYAEQAIQKNYLRLETIITDAFQEEDKQTLLKALDMQNRMLSIYSRANQKTIEIENNTQDNTLKFRINIGNQNQDS